MEPVNHVFPGRKPTPQQTAAAFVKLWAHLMANHRLVADMSRRIEALEREADENGWAHK